MLKTKRYQTANGVVSGIKTDLSDIAEWHPTVGQVREAILSFLITGAQGMEKMMPPEMARFAPTQRDVEGACEYCVDAVRAGRLIDFGDWTNETIKYGGLRGGALYSKAAIGHPFRDPYVFMHTWEHASSVYLVVPLEPERTAGDCEVMELQPLRVSDTAMLMIGDRVLLTPDAESPARYHCRAIPSIWRFYPGMQDMNNHGSPEGAAVGNALDPLMTGLLILSTRGIVRETVRASDKLARARAKNGKPAIPPYERVISAPYVTAIANRRLRGRGVSLGGTHASPIMHVRIGHIRNYPSGRQVFVRDAIVNATEEAKAGFMRSHYAAR